MVTVRPPDEGRPPGTVGLLAWGPESGDLVGWQVEGVLVVTDDRLTIHELLVRPRDLAETAPAGGVTTSVLRAVPLGALLDAGRRALLQAPEQIASWEDSSGQRFESLKAAAERAAAAVRETDLKRGRKGFPDDHYRWVALEYLKLQEEGWSKGILRELAGRAAAHLGRDYVARETARDWVATARSKGFLSKATQGRAGASPGPNLYTKENDQ